MGKPDRCQTCGQPLPETTEKCEACGQTRFKVTKKFGEFLDAHVPFIREPLWAWVRNVLYGVRSDLAHGNDVMHRDMAPLTVISVKLSREFSIERATRHVAATAIRNWLVSRSKAHEVTG